MTPTRADEEKAEKLLPCSCLYDQDQWKQQVGNPEPPKFTEHAYDCPAYYRPAVARALAKAREEVEAKEAEVKRLRDALMQFYLRKHTAGPQAAYECEQRARAALGARRPNEHEACHGD